MEEQEITKELKKDGTTRLFVNPSIYPLITKLINSKHKQFKLKNDIVDIGDPSYHSEPNRYFLNGVLVTFQDEEIYFSNRGEGFNISPGTGLNFFLNPVNKNKPYKYSDEEKNNILSFLKSINYNNDKVDKLTEQNKIIKKWMDEMDKEEEDSEDSEEDLMGLTKEEYKRNSLNLFKNRIYEIGQKIKENSENVTKFEMDDVIKMSKSALKILNKNPMYETPDFNKDIIHEILNRMKNFQQGEGLHASAPLSFIFLPTDPHELCNRLRLLYQEKMGGNNNPQIDQEIMAISDKFLEHEIITTEQHENMMNTLL